MVEQVKKRESRCTTDLGACVAPGCGAPAVCYDWESMEKRYCAEHGVRVFLHGTPDAGKRVPKAKRTPKCPVEDGE